MYPDCICPSPNSFWILTFPLPCLPDFVFSFLVPLKFNPCSSYVWPCVEHVDLPVPFCHVWWLIQESTIGQSSVNTRLWDGQQGKRSCFAPSRNSTMVIWTLPHSNSQVVMMLGRYHVRSEVTKETAASPCSFIF